MPRLCSHRNGGDRKTTLARKIFNHSKIQSKFPVRAWLCISQDFQRIDKLKEVVRKVGGRPPGEESESELLDLLWSAVSGKRFFVVLDDVWQANVWLDLFRSPLHGGASGSRVLVTTRDENVAKRMGAVIHGVELLSVYSGWQLLQKSAYLNEAEIQSLWKIGIKIVEKCRGLPLAIKIIAGDLTTKDHSRMEWEKVLTSHAWSVTELPEELSGALYLSYYNLPSHLKQCFLYFSLYPEDYTFHRTDLIRHWVAEGFIKKRGDSFMEDLAEEYYQELIQRNLLQPNPRYIMNKEKCTMHDLLRSLAVFLSQDESFYGDVTKSNITTTKTKLRRLSIPETGEVAVIPESVKEQKCLRTLLLLRSPPRLENHMLMQLPFLRVLVLRGSGIQSITDSLCTLIHLRLLDLEDTSISSLPESLGNLSNLQILNLSRCHSLYTLPKGVTCLHNLIHLDLGDTPLSFVPKGIGSLQQLNLLRGFVVGNDDVMEEGQQEEGCSLEELKPLSQLRRLSIENLERAQRGILAVSDKVHLKELWLCWTIDYERAADTYTEEEMDRIEKLYEELLPPPCLETLLFLGFIGRGHPSWMRSSSLATSLPCLTCLSLMNCILCRQLPPLGQLPNLRILVINKASAIITIGPEFLGGRSAEPLAFFPKLEMLKFIEMPNWEEWSFGGGFDEEHHAEKEKKPPELLLLPRLKVLHIEDCPKLRALPRGLRYCAMEKLYIYTAHSLRDISNLPFVTEFVQLKCNHSLEAVSHLPALKQLIALDCPVLQCVENLDALECLYLIDGSMECLPKWLLTLLPLQQQHNRIDNLRFYLHCNRRVLERCLKGCPDWSIVELIPHVNI